MTVQELHDLYARGIPIPTQDARILADGTVTRDEILTSINSGKVIGLGTVWDGTGVNAKLDAATAVVRDIVNGLASGRVLHAEDPGVVITLGRTYAALAKDEGTRKTLGSAIDQAESLWKADKRSTDKGPAHDLPPNNETTDSSPVRRNILTGSAKGISTADYAANLKKGRETQATVAPTTVTSAKDYAATLAAGRAKSRG